MAADPVEGLLRRNLLEIFGEPDAVKRRATIAAIWAEDGVFVDSHGRSVGHEALNKAVDQLYLRFPDSVFTAIGPPQAFHDVGRQRWGHGPPGGPRKVTGLDVVTVRDGRIAALFAFVDTPPTG
jgi:ketosteroid isomerase-like protein